MTLLIWDLDTWEEITNNDGFTTRGQPEGTVADVVQYGTIVSAPDQVNCNPLESLMQSGKT